MEYLRIYMYVYKHIDFIYRYTYQQTWNQANEQRVGVFGSI